MGGGCNLLDKEVVKKTLDGLGSGVTTPEGLVEVIDHSNHYFRVATNHHFKR